MFLVIRQTTNTQGRPVYKVRNVNSGKTGYTLASRKHFANAYYSAKVTRIKVISSKGINEYSNRYLSNKKHHVKKNRSLAVRKVVGYGRTSRLLLTNGRYVSGNKKTGDGNQNCQDQSSNN